MQVSVGASPRSLGHIRVLDLTRVLAGPWCTQNLADLGADVIKIERPGEGDDTRGWGPPFLVDANGEQTREAAYFLACNRGKRSVALDISTPQGQDIVRTLAAASDVFVENYKVGTLARYGLSYEDLKKVRSDIVYCSISGYGQDGPRAQMPGYDFVFQGMSGLMSINGERDDRPGGGPQRVGVPISDLITGMYSTVAILAALAHRAVSGHGQYIDMALLDSTVALLAIPAMNYLTSGAIPRRQGNAHANIVPYQTFQCADGFIVLAVGNDTQFASFCKVAGRPEIAQHPMYRTNSARLANRDALTALLHPIMASRTMDDWVGSLDGANVPCGPINDIAQMFKEPQVEARGLLTEISHPVAGLMPLVASPMKMSETPVQYRRPPPLLGEHTREVLGELAGLGEDALSALSDQGITRACSRVPSERGPR